MSGHYEKNDLANGMPNVSFLKSKYGNIFVFAHHLNVIRYLNFLLCKQNDYDQTIPVLLLKKGFPLQI